MKRILLAGSAIVTLGAAAFAFDGDSKQDTHARTVTEHRVVVGDGPVVELRGTGGERTLHMERDGNDTVLTLNGQRVEIANGTVTIDGQTIEAGPSSIVVVDGDDIRVVEGDFEFAFDTEFAAHMAERAELMARAHTELAEHFEHDFAVDMDGIQAEVLASLEETLARLEREDVHAWRDWDDLSEEERAEVREAMREARDEVRRAMEEIRVELRNVEREMNSERRHIRIEMRDAQRELARAEREVERAAHERHRVEVLRHGREEARADARGMRESLRLHRRDSGALGGERRSVRIEESDDGRRRVWIDGEEQTGDDLTRWLNELESDRLAGAPAAPAAPGMPRHVERLEWHDGGEHRVIELDGGNRVVILERRERIDEE